jgi:hypothetical protein
MQKKLADEVMVCLLSAPETMSYYPHIGFQKAEQAWWVPLIIEEPLPDTKRANSPLLFLPFPTVHPGEIQTRNGNRKQLNSMEDGTTLRAL